MRILIGIFIILHGLVHLWYVTLSREWIKFEAEMGWTGESWLLTGMFGSKFTRTLTTIFYSLAAFAFVIAGLGLTIGSGWSQTWMVSASLISLVSIVVFWDGSPRMPVEKGLLGFLINIGILIAVIVFNWPA